MIDCYKNLLHVPEFFVFYPLKLRFILRQFGPEDSKGFIEGLAGRIRSTAKVLGLARIPRYDMTSCGHYEGILTSHCC